MIVRKILETTIPSGGSTAIFNDNDIPNSLIRVYSTNTNLFPQSVNLVGTTLTVTYESVSSSMGVALEIVKQGLEIIDNVISSDSDKSLSAKQGKVLKDLIDGVASVVNNLTVFDLDDVLISSISDGQILAWDAEEEMFVNVNQSGGDSSHTYSTDEQFVGTWIDGASIYEKTYYFTTAITVRVDGGWYDTGIDASHISKIINGVVGNDTWIMGVFSVFKDSNKIKLTSAGSMGSNQLTIKRITIQYTKIVS